MRPIALTLICAGLLAGQTGGEAIAGFTGESTKRQHDLEARFDKLLDRQNLQQWMKRMTAKAHHVGSPASREVAEYIASHFRSWGYETRIDTYYPLFPTPKTRLVEMVAPTRFTAMLEEPALESDATSKVREGSLPIYNAYSIDGDVTGELVYVNYGVPADYDQLRELGIDVKGKIVIARYGASWRGIKPKVAAEHGAIACIIYSDPRDDGYFAGDVYPKGGYRPAQSAQRGSVMDMPTYPGDPLTPGEGATDPNRKPDPHAAATVTKIPVLPISYGDAEPLLRALAGPVAPVSWRGALPITYHVGPGPAKVRVNLEFDWRLAPAHNVVATMRGAEKPDQWILRGNHHDGWNFGAHDPISGMVAVMEEARALAELIKTGWKPKRTIMFLAWDGEEPALLGSTEWAEAHADELKQHAVAYLNTDGTGRGFVGLSGSPMLATLASQSARDVTDPQTRVSVMERRLARQKSTEGEAEFQLPAVGSGSDYTAFVDHLGIPVLNFGFGGEGHSGVYHSIYDSYDHYTKFVDPDFQYPLATAQLGGRMVLRLAEADLLPLQVDPLAKAVRRWTTEVTKLAEDMRGKTRKRNELIRSGVLKLAADPREPFAAPDPESEVPFLNFAPLLNSLTRLDAAAELMNSVDAGKLTVPQRSALEQKLIQAERKLTRDEGLPKRPWFRHLLYAPGYYTGYGVKTLPGVREAVEERRWAEAESQISLLAATLEDYAKWIEGAVEVTK